MTCPSEQMLLRMASGELVEEIEMIEHFGECKACEKKVKEYKGLITSLGDLEPGAGNDEYFVQGVLDKCTEGEAASVARMYRRPWMYGFAAVAAAAAIWFTRPAMHNVVDVVTARGHAGRSMAAVTPDVMLLRDKVLLPIEGAKLHPSDGIAVRYWNVSAEPVYMAVFALDSASAVHWIYPAYLDAALNPASIRLERSVEGRFMSEAVEPEAPASGPFKIVALVTSTPLSVREIEATIAARGRRTSNLFPNARVREWSCTWVAR